MFNHFKMLYKKIEKIKLIFRDFIKNKVIKKKYLNKVQIIWNNLSTSYHTCRN